MTTNKEKALWLQKHYGGYSLQWYLSDSEPPLPTHTLRGRGFLGRVQTY